jgi:hypothetical protein
MESTWPRSKGSELWLPEQRPQGRVFNPAVEGAQKYWERGRLAPSSIPYREARENYTRAGETPALPVFLQILFGGEPPSG